MMLGSSEEFGDLCTALFSDRGVDLGDVGGAMTKAGLGSIEAEQLAGSIDGDVEQLGHAIRESLESAVTDGREEARRGVLLSLVSDVATSYFHLRALDRELDVARRTAGAFAETH
jgi:hypothetical protein